MSLVSLLTNSGKPWRTDFFLEHVAENVNGNAIWAGIRDSRWKYVRYWTGDEKLYDLNADPYELNSQQKNATLNSLKTMMWTRTRSSSGWPSFP